MKEKKEQKAVVKACKRYIESHLYEDLTISGQRIHSHAVHDLQAGYRTGTVVASGSLPVGIQQVILLLCEDGIRTDLHGIIKQRYQ